MRTQLCCLALGLSMMAPVSMAASMADHSHNANGSVIYPKITIPKGVDAEKVKRGEYLVKAGNCAACHTAPDGDFMAGGVPLNTPFGKYYSPNITPNTEQGLGNWTTKEFIRAFKSARRANGSFLFPVFPYLWYHQIKTEDLKDIWAYMQLVPSSTTPSKPIEAALPFRIRLGMLGWNILFFYPYKTEIKDDPQKPDAWNRGRYLVESLGHCGMCHTPINFLGAPKRSQAYYGGMVDGYTAPPINSVSLKAYSVDQIVRIFTHNELPGGGKISAPPMMEVNTSSLQHLETSDLQAIATYLKTIPGPKVAAIDTSAKGGKTYLAHCASCHATGAGGAPKMGDASAWSQRLSQGKQSLYDNAIKGYNGMPAKGNCLTCSDQSIKDAIDFMVTSSMNQAKDDTPKGPAPQAPTLALGKTIYQQACASCHQEGTHGAPKMGDIQAWAPRVKKGMLNLFSYAFAHYKHKDGMPSCYTCDDTDLIAAVKYMVQQSIPEGDVTLW